MPKDKWEKEKYWGTYGERSNPQPSELWNFLRVEKGIKFWRYNQKKKEK